MSGPGLPGSLLGLVETPGPPARSKLAVLLVIAAATRVIGLGQDFWIDETATAVTYLRLPFWKVVQTYHSANQHLLYSVLGSLSFAAFGIYLYPNLGAPTQVHSVPSARMAGGDVNRDGRDELVIDFGPAYGIWVRNFSVGWSQVNTQSSQDVILGDINNNGQADILVDFGPVWGLWIYVDNASWIQAHTLNPEGLAIGDLKPQCVRRDTAG